MSTINKLLARGLTHEGLKASRINPEQALRRSLMACMLWEKTFYEDGQDVAERIASLIPLVNPYRVADLAIEAREDMKLRHVPLLVAREMARLPEHKKLVAMVLEKIIQRPDELTEFLAIYWKDKKEPLSGQVKKGLAKAFQKFNEYSLAKYNRDGAVKLRDVLFLCHAKPKDKAQDKLWKRLIKGELKTPDTWEVALSSGEDKKKVWERLIKEGNLGALAFLRNLRNMFEASVNEKIIFNGLKEMKTERVLPFRFIAAARYAPQWEPQIEELMLRALDGQRELKGKTVLLIDTSPSMDISLSDKSEMSRKDAALGLAILCRELCEKVEIWAFSSDCKMVPARRGFALSDAINNAVESDGTLIGKAVSTVSGRYDRIICITDEESQDAVKNPDKDTNSYLINIATYKNGVGYGAWNHIDGWSEKILNYIEEIEKSND